eukprot:scaffold303382_cov27-Prasinocladus_malaysianus.AAC.1
MVNVYIASRMTVLAQGAAHHHNSAHNSQLPLSCQDRSRTEWYACAQRAVDKSEFELACTSFVLLVTLPYKVHGHNELHSIQKTCQTTVVASKRGRLIRF